MGHRSSRVMAAVNHREKAVRLLLDRNPVQLRKHLAKHKLRLEGCGDDPALLLVAAQYSSADCLRVLLNAGAQVNAAGCDSRTTALVLAAEHSGPEVLRVLVNNGADLNYRRPSDGQTALLRAIAFGKSQNALVLIEVSPAATARLGETDSRTGRRRLLHPRHHERSNPPLRGMPGRPRVHRKAPPCGWS